MLAGAAGVCNPQALPAACAEEPVFLSLLATACQLCHVPFAGERPAVFQPCLEDKDGLGLGDLAMEIAMRYKVLDFCRVGILAAVLITLQYSASTRPFDTEGWLKEQASSAPRALSWGDGFDLSPYPFWSERRSLYTQVDFHSRYFAVHLFNCRETPTSVRGKYSLRACQDKPETHCALQMSDYQLVHRCRAKRESQKFRGMHGVLTNSGGSMGLPGPVEGARVPGVSSIQCPSAEARDSFAARKATEDEAHAQRELSQAQVRNKYAQRAAGGFNNGLGCDDPEAEWRVDLRHYHKCILVVVLDRMRLAPGSRVLDWGSGCGHKLTWAAQFYDLEGLGVEIVRDNVNWAKENSIGHFCEVDGRFLSWLPDSYFDGVISYAALAHLEPEDQCEVVVELVTKVRVGGRLWFGWNAPEIWANNTDLERKWMLPADQAWGSCFETAARVDQRWQDISVLWEVVPERFLYPDDQNAIGVYIYLHPSYSLFITRVRRGEEHQGIV